MQLPQIFWDGAHSQPLVISRAGAERGTCTLSHWGLAQTSLYGYKCGAQASLWRGWGWGGGRGVYRWMDRWVNGGMDEEA